MKTPLARAAFALAALCFAGPLCGCGGPGEISEDESAERAAAQQQYSQDRRSSMESDR